MKEGLRGVKRREGRSEGEGRGVKGRSEGEGVEE